MNILRPLARLPAALVIGASAWVPIDPFRTRFEKPKGCQVLYEGECLKDVMFFARSPEDTSNASSGSNT